MPKVLFKERVWKEREQVILAEAGKLMREYGFEKLNMDKVAEAVGIAKPTLYQHFRSKDDLIAQVLINGMTMLLEEPMQFIQTDEEDTEAQRRRQRLRFQARISRLNCPNGQQGQDCIGSNMCNSPQGIIDLEHADEPVALLTSIGTLRTENH